MKPFHPANSDDLEASYQRWVHSQLVTRAYEYSESEELQIMCCTWNVNAKTPPSGSGVKYLRQWLIPPGSGETNPSSTTTINTSGLNTGNENAMKTTRPDVYAVGLQEIVNLNMMNMVISQSASVEAGAQWVRRILRALNAEDDDDDDMDDEFAEEDNMDGSTNSRRDTKDGRTVRKSSSSGGGSGKYSGMNNNNHNNSSSISTMQDDEDQSANHDTCWDSGGSGKNNSNKYTKNNTFASSGGSNKSTMSTGSLSRKSSKMSNKPKKVKDPSTQYEVKFRKTMVGLMFAVFVKKSLASRIHEVKCAMTYTGAYGVTGNKGGISVSLKYNNTSICFVHAHFHAHQENIEQRNMDYHLICQNKDFMPWYPTTTTSSRNTAAARGSTGTTPTRSNTAAAERTSQRRQNSISSPFSISSPSKHTQQQQQSHTVAADGGGGSATAAAAAAEVSARKALELAAIEAEVGGEGPPMLPNTPRVPQQLQQLQLLQQSLDAKKSGHSSLSPQKGEEDNTTAHLAKNLLQRTAASMMIRTKVAPVATTGTGGGEDCDDARAGGGGGGGGNYKEDSLSNSSDNSDAVAAMARGMDLSAESADSPNKSPRHPSILRSTNNSLIKSIFHHSNHPPAAAAAGDVAAVTGDAAAAGNAAAVELTTVNLEGTSGKSQDGEFSQPAHSNNNSNNRSTTGGSESHQSYPAADASSSSLPGGGVINDKEESNSARSPGDGEDQFILEDPEEKFTMRGILGLEEPKEPSMTVLEHDFVIFQGDLNYRIDANLDITEVFDRIQRRRWDTLCVADQLHTEKQKHNVFHGFNEGALSFKPTYKYRPGSDEYETRDDKKLRMPAWCDRILWKCLHSERDVTLVDYRATNALRISDHKPVSALLLVNTQRIVHDKLRALYQNLLSTVDDWIEAATPKMEVFNRSVEFGAVTNNCRYRSTIGVQNIGSVLAEWSFIPQEGETEVTNSWIHISPLEGVLAPGARIDVEITLEINLEEAYTIVNHHSNELDDILVIRVKNGNDYFCVINGCVDAETCDKVCKAYAKLHIDRSLVRKVVGRQDDESEGEASGTIDGEQNSSSLKDLDLSDSVGEEEYSSSNHRIDILRSSLLAGKGLLMSPESVHSAATGGGTGTSRSRDRGSMGSYGSQNNHATGGDPYDMGVTEFDDFGTFASPNDPSGNNNNGNFHSSASKFHSFGDGLGIAEQEEEEEGEELEEDGRTTRKKNASNSSNRHDDDDNSGDDDDDDDATIVASGGPVLLRYPYHHSEPNQSHH